MTPLYKTVSGNGFSIEPETGFMDFQSMKICNVLFENTPVPFFVVSPDGCRFIYVNAAVCRLLGYPQNELLSIPAKAVISPASLVNLCDAIHRSSAAGEDNEGITKVPQRRVEIFRRDRTILTVDIKCQLTKTNENSIVAISGIGDVVSAPASLVQENKSASGSRVDESAVKPGRILIMDDEDILIDIALQMGKRLGLLVDTVKNCRDAVAAYRKSIEENDPHDIILLDMTIAGGTGGLETLEALQKVNPQVKAVVMSGFADHEVMSSPEKYGFSAVITKPFRLNEFSKALKGLLPPGKFIKC